MSPESQKTLNSASTTSKQPSESQKNDEEEDPNDKNIENVNKTTGYPVIWCSGEPRESENTELGLKNFKTTFGNSEK